MTLHTYELVRRYRMLSMLKQAIGSRGCSPSAIIASHHDAATIPAKSNNNSGGVRIRSSGYSGTARRRRHHGLLRLPLLRLRLPLAWKRCYYQQRQSTKFTSSPSPRYLAFVTYPRSRSRSRVSYGLTHWPLLPPSAPLVSPAPSRVLRSAPAQLWDRLEGSGRAGPRADLTSSYNPPRFMLVN